MKREQGYSQEKSCRKGWGVVEGKKGWHQEQC